MITLGIETSCDETGAAVVEDGRILSNIVSSSVPLHEKYGGVVPEIASRFHIEYINQVTKRALRKARKAFKDLDLIAVTDSPGLPGSLLTGKSFAKALGFALGIPCLTVDHLAAHLYVNFLVEKRLPVQFPFVGVVVSGGHRNIFICKSASDIETIGRTKDDAIGEAFDKVAKILGIGYPGGPRIEKYARTGARLKAIRLPRSYMGKDSFDFSLSGIKTAVLYYMKKHPASRREIARISWSFQEAVFDVLVEKVLKACKKFGIKEILLGGGVISNMTLCAKMKRASEVLGYKLFYPPPRLCVDNAAMVAGLGEELYRTKSK